MGITSTAKKLQTVTEMAEKLYNRVDELRTEINALRDGVEETRERTVALEEELAGQRAILEALAAEQGIDTETLIQEATTNADASENGAAPATDPEAPTVETGEKTTANES